MLGKRGHMIRLVGGGAGVNREPLVRDAIVIQGLTKTFGPKVAVDNLDMVVPTGSLCGFIGPNGAGKTTTIRMIMSILFPDRGQLSVLGKASALDSKDRIGYLPEERGLYRKMKVGAFLTYIARIKGVDPHGLTATIKTWLDRVELADVYRKKCEELSKGMQQKVQFVAAVLHKPELLILDEPFSGLDPVNTRLLRDLFNEQHAGGTTVIFSTHVLVQAEQLCDRIVMIHEGRKVLDSTMTQIRARFDPRTILVEVPDAAAGLEALRGRPGVHAVRPENGLLSVSLEDGADPQHMLRLIVGLVPALRVELKRPTLEDVFVQIVEDTGGRTDERQPGGGNGAAAPAVPARSGAP